MMLAGQSPIRLKSGLNNYFKVAIFWIKIDGFSPDGWRARESHQFKRYKVVPFGDAEGLLN